VRGSRAGDSDHHRARLGWELRLIALIARRRTLGALLGDEHPEGFRPRPVQRVNMAAGAANQLSHRAALVVQSVQLSCQGQHGGAITRRQRRIHLSDDIRLAEGELHYRTCCI